MKVPRAWLGVWTLWFVVGAASAQELKFTFEDGKLDAWLAVDETDLGDKGPSAWAIANSAIDGKAIVQTSNIWGDATDTVAIGTMLLYNKADFTNFVLECDVFAQDNDGMGIVWAYKSLEEHYRVFTMIDSGNSPNGLKGPYRIMEKRLGKGAGSKLPFYAKPLDIVEGKSYAQGARIHWKLEVMDGTFVFSQDGEQVLKGTDLTYTKGKVGFQLYAQNSVAFDNVVIIDLGLAVSAKERLASRWAALKTIRE
jgi:hypothetical protein